ncbi:MAG: hypothetical protein AB8G99_06140 [Planctomycetaceae bacterium]
MSRSTQGEILPARTAREPGKSFLERLRQCLPFAELWLHKSLSHMVLLRRRKWDHGLAHHMQ